MPLDDTGFRPDPAAYVLKPSQAYSDRWSCKEHIEVVPRGITLRSDADALLHIWKMMERNWSRKFNDGDNHCIVGWAAETTEPTTLCQYGAGQLKRILQRLHDALPKSAQRQHTPHRLTLAKYNDTHSLPTVRAVVFRAYLAEVNAHIEALNQPHA